MLIDVHAHFLTERALRADWSEVNARRLQAGDRMGITAHVASVLGSWGSRSPVYFPSPDDVTEGNQYLLGLQRQHRGKVFGYCTVNPNFTDHALREIDLRIKEGMVGVKLAASRRANDRLLDPIAERAGKLGVPILHHIWQHRRREWPGQEASDAAELRQLAERHPGTRFLLAGRAADLRVSRSPGSPAASQWWARRWPAAWRWRAMARKRPKGPAARRTIRTSRSRPHNGFQGSLRWRRLT